MYEEGVISLWLGEADSEQQLEDYIRLDYTDDGDLVPSQLMKDFELVDDDGDFNDYDEGCREISLLKERQRTIAAALKDFSYADQIIPKFSEILGEKVEFDINAVALLFNYRANVTANKKVIESNGVRLRFMGVTSYQMR